MPRRGENIYKRKDGRWEGRYIKEYVEEKAVYGYIYAKTYAEVKKKLASARELPSKKEQVTIQEPTQQIVLSFGMVAAEWLEVSKVQLKDSSIVKYTNLLTDYILPFWEDKAIDSIIIENIVEYSNTLLLCGGKKGEGLAPKTVTSIISVLKSIFKYAAQYKRIAVLNLDGYSIKQPQKPMRVLTLPEQQKLCQYLCKDLSLTNLGIMLCLYTGIRIGEVCALKWEDIDFEAQQLHVNKTMQRIQNKGNNIKKTSIIITEPKSECSIRMIPLPDELFKLIVTFKCPQNTYLLTGHAYEFVEPRTLQNRFKRIIKTCNIRDVNFHALRHTFATRCIELGFDIKSLSEILGHANVNITLNRYVHPSMELKQKNMNMLSDLFAVK